jgi:phosphohistidine swiveling domain-containing protein
MLSDAPAKAWRVIANGLVGDGVDSVARQVLDGSARLTGDSATGIGVAEDNAAEYIEQLRYLYSGRVQIYGSWMRPVARVVRWGPEDMKFAERARVAGGRVVLVGRSRAYCKPGEVLGPDEVIFAPCGEPPHWWDPCPSQEQAIAEREDRLDERGFGDWEPDEELPDEELLRRAWGEDREGGAEAQVSEMQEEILRRAGDDLLRLDYTDEDGQPAILFIPRAPFLRWVAHRYRDRVVAPPWQNVAPDGMKMFLDDPNHTDWLIGAGIPLDQSYTHASDNAVHELISRLVWGDYDDELMGIVVVPGTVVQASVVHGCAAVGSVVVLPDLGARRVPLMEGAGCIVTEAGGPGAHLAQVALEKRVPIIRLPRARELLPEGAFVEVNTATGRVRRIS